MLQAGLDVRVVEIDIREEDVEEGFGALQSVLERFDVLRRGVASAIRRLVVRTFYSTSQHSL